MTCLSVMTLSDDWQEEMKKTEAPLEDKLRVMLLQKFGSLEIILKIIKNCACWEECGSGYTCTACHLGGIVENIFDVRV